MNLPVKMLVNASSTLVESKADVSINAKLFLSIKSLNKQTICSIYNLRIHILTVSHARTQVCLTIVRPHRMHSTDAAYCY